MKHIPVLQSTVLDLLDPQVNSRRRQARSAQPEPEDPVSPEAPKERSGDRYPIRVKHVPVLLNVVLDLLAPKQGETILDVTVGLGGHAQAFLERIGPRGKLIGIDADEENLEAVKQLFSETVEQWQKRVQLIHANFRDFPSLFPLRQAQGDVLFDVIFADLGLSSPHLDDPARGFSFRYDGPLDCRYDRTKGKTAAELLEDLPERELQKIFREYGELPKVGALVEAMLTKRKVHSIATTHDLVRIVEEVYGWRARSLLAQVFQALRIAVNDELHALQALLKEGPKLLKAGGRMGIISYHSLEDRMVKQRFRELTAVTKHPVTGAPLVNGVGLAPRSSFGSGVGFQLLTKKALKPTLQEIEAHPRARSARFRAIRASTFSCSTPCSLPFYRRQRSLRGDRASGA